MEAPLPERDRELERELLDRVQAPNGFAQLVQARLDRFESRHGNIGWEAPLDELLAEIQEAADIFGWGVGAAMQLDEAKRHRLAVAMSLGVKAWEEIQALRELLARELP